MAFRALSAASRRLLLLAFLFAKLGLSVPAHAQTTCLWALLLEDGGPTESGGSATWSVGDDIFLTLLDSSGHAPMTGITSSNPGVVSVTIDNTRNADADTLASGTATLTATTTSAECPTYTLNVTVEVTEPPTTGDTTTSVDANSTDNTVNLGIDGYEITSVAIASQPTNGTATASGTTITYTPDAGYAGSDSFTYTATNAAGTSAPATATITVSAPTVALSPASLPDGAGGTAYSQALTASGGTAPYSFAVTAGGLPDGLSLAADGTLSGTPTAAGSFAFTVTATDDNGFTGTSDYTLVVDAPTIALTPASLPGGKEGTAYGPVTLTASGGTGPYKYAVTAGSLPAGLDLTADGALSGIPGEGGGFAFTVTATDDHGFTGSRDYMLTLAELILPDVQDHTFSVLAGTSGTLDLTQGATGGPFTGAAIATPAPSDAGTARIERKNGAYILHFAAAGTFAGTASLTYTLSNADGTSEPATATIEVVARPDPSQDPEVIGLVRAQTEAAKRFARTQIGNFNRRLEQLHDEGERRSSSIDLNVGIETSGRNAYAQEEETPAGPALGALDRATREAGYEPGLDAPRADNPLGDLAIWTGGYVNFGTNDDGGLDLDHTLVGVSGGLDYRFTPSFTAGLGIGYGHDATDVGDNGTESRAHALSLAAYGSYRPAPAFFIDGLVGYSFMDFDSWRHVTATGAIATGTRDGHQVFGSLSAGYEHRRDGLLLSPYGRLEASRSTLDRFTESGGGIWNLTYGEQTIETLSGTLGLRAEYGIAMEWGVLTPRARLEYTHDFEGSSRASLGYADIGGLPYTLDVEAFSRDYLTIGLGFDADIGESWNLGFDYRTAFGTDGDSRNHTFALSLGARF